MTGGDYFTALGAALRAAGYHRPALVIDLDRLDANIAAVRRHVPPHLALRIVDKSLPSIDLIRRISAATGTRRIMSFHLPVTLAVLAAMPDAEVLYGKPLPVAAVADALRTLSAADAERFAVQTTFLIDTEARLEQFAALARSSGRRLRLAFEVDVGMHRGGFPDPQALASAWGAVKRQGDVIVIEGIMAYEAHIPEIPGLFGGSKAEARKVRARFEAFAAVLPADARKILNTGGSKTALTYGDGGLVNEVSIGSGFVKPVDFDVPALDELKPAAFIATPILKVGPARLPGPPVMTRLVQGLGLFSRQGCFLYGGKWMAEPVFPVGMKESGLWGHSSNQQFMALPADADVAVDDFAFFRPTQSEAVLQQFGPLALYSEGRISGAWPVLLTG